MELEQIDETVYLWVVTSDHSLEEGKERRWKEGKIKMSASIQ